MGILRGDLSVLGIGNLLQTLTHNRCEGTLTVELGAHSKAFELHGDRLRLVRGSRRCQKLEKVLRRVGPVLSDSAGEPVLEGGAPTRESVGRLVREWMLDELSDLFTWTRGTFRFRETTEFEKPHAASPASLAAHAPECDLMTAILEAAHRADELPRLRASIPDTSVVPERASGIDDRESPNDADALDDVLPLIDGKRTVAEILQASVFPRSSVLRTLHRLAQRGAVTLGAAAVPSPLSSVA